MAITLIAPAVLAAAAAAAIAFAPAALADDVDDLKSPGRGQQKTTQEVVKVSPQQQQQKAWNSAPKGWTNEAQWARPGASNPFGTLPKPPVFAMD